MGVLCWFNGVGQLGWVFWECRIACTCFFILRPEVLRRALSHIWCKLYLPIFQISVGLLVNRFFNSSGNAVALPLYYLEVLLGARVTCIDVMIYRGGFLQVLLESFSKGPRGFPYVFIITCKVPMLELVGGLTFVSYGILVHGETIRFLMVLLPLKWVCIPYLLQIFWCFCIDLRCRVYLYDS